MQRNSNVEIVNRAKGKAGNGRWEFRVCYAENQPTIPRMIMMYDMNRPRSGPLNPTLLMVYPNHAEHDRVCAWLVANKDHWDRLGLIYLKDGADRMHAVINEYAEDGASMGSMPMSSKGR